MVKKTTPKTNQPKSGKAKIKSASKTKAKATVKVRKKVATTKRVVASKRRAVKKAVVKKQKAVKNNIPVPSEIGGMKTASFVYLITGVFEFVMAIPFLGWLTGVSSFGFMWIAGIVLNIVAIVTLVNRKKPIYANIIAIIANVFGIVPFLGWSFHLVAVILLTILFFKEEKKN